MVLGPIADSAPLLAPTERDPRRLMIDVPAEDVAEGAPRRPRASEPQRGETLQVAARDLVAEVEVVIEQQERRERRSGGAR